MTQRLMADVTQRNAAFSSERPRLVTLSRARVAALYRRLDERSRMAATARAAREYESFANYFAAMLRGKPAVITLRQPMPWLRHLCRLAGDVDVAFEIGLQLEGSLE